MKKLRNTALVGFFSPFFLVTFFVVVFLSQSRGLVELLH